MTHHTMSERSYHGATSHSPGTWNQRHKMKVFYDKNSKSKHLGQVRSGQVRSRVFNCTFRASCCSTHLLQAQVPAFAGSSVGRKRGEGVREDCLHWWLQMSTSSPTRIGSRWRIKNVHPQQRKEGNVLFNNTLNTFYIQLYSVRHKVKDHSDSKRGNQLPPHRLLSD